jgi:CXXX repeat peptide maturase
VGIVAGLSQTNGGFECSILTDRLLLREMRNCAAGIEHVTVAPNGRFYLCPGFYYRDDADAIGSLRDGLQVRNPQLLTVDHAPICRRCDAYHCRRCLLLNKTLTGEINTPSWQQCVSAHHEREASRALLGLLRQRGRLAGAMAKAEIPPLSYSDPFEMVRLAGGEPVRQGADDSGSPSQEALGDGPVMEEVNTLRQMVLELRASQQQILQEISQLRKERLREEQETK